MISFIKRKYKLIILLIIVAMAIYFGYQKRVKDLVSKKQETTSVQKGDLEEILIISGEVDAEEKITLRFKTSGRISWIGVKEGDHVKKYQTVATLDKRILKKNLEKELNDYLSERWDFEQTTKDDYRDQVITDTFKRILEKAQFDLNIAVLDVELDDITLKYANLWTPIEGIVTRVESPYAGVNITATQAEFDIVNPNTIFFSANADQTEVIQIKENMTGELVLDSYPEETILGTINNISFIPKAGETATVYAIKYVFNHNNDNSKYRIGMTGDLTFITKSKKDVLYLPIKFISEKNGKKYVTVDKEGQMEKQFIITGLETENSLEIVSGIKKGTKVYK